MNRATTPALAATPGNAQRQRLALVIHALHGGGAERLMSQLANRWAQAGHEIHLITLADTSTDQYAILPGVQRHGLNMLRPSRGPWVALKANWQRVRSLRRLIAEVSPDAVISFCDRMNITTVSALLSGAIPLCIAEHSDPSRQHLGIVWETWRQWAYRQLARRPRSGCVVLNDAIADTMRKRFPGLKIEVIPPAIHLYDLPNTITQQQTGALESAQSDQLQLLSMGRHSPEKNLTGLLQAWHKLAPLHPQWRLVLAGDGPQHAELVELAQQLRIGGSVHFAGWVTDPWSLYRQCNLLAMTSHYEGVPVSLLEAMAAGLPCVSTPCSTTVAEFAQLGAVKMTRSSTPSDIAQALELMMADEAGRRQLAERGQEVAQKFSWEAIGLRWDELLSKLT